MAFRNIMLYGAGGSNIGHHILQALANDSTIQTAVLAREGSMTAYPPSVRIAKVPGSLPHEALFAALQGQDVVICAPQAQQEKLLEAAIEAGVKHFYPSEWGMDNAETKNQALTYLQLKESEAFSWTAVATIIWLDWALDSNFIGIDPVAHAVQYWHNGTHRTTMTTLPYASQAVLATLKHPEMTKNQRVFVSRFEASHRELVAELESLQGVDYAVSYVSEHVVEETHAKIGAGDADAVAATITAEVLLPEYHADFVTSRKKPLLEEIAEMPHLSAQSVVAAWVKAHPQ